MRNPKAEDSRFYFFENIRRFYLNITICRINDYFLLVIRNQVDVIIVMLDSIKNHIIIWRIYFGQKTGTEACQKARRFF